MDIKLASDADVTDRRMSKNPLKHLSCYELRHLVSHLAAAACTEDVHRLLVLETDTGRNAWHERKYAIGDVAGYLENIVEAWRLTERDANVCHVAAVRCLQYVLMIASINSLSQTVPPRLMAAAVEKEIWGVEQGLTYARRCPDPKQRIEALIFLAPMCTPQLQHHVFSEAIASASAIEDRYKRASALLALTDNLPDDHKLALIHEGLRIADELGPSGLKKLFEATPEEFRRQLIPAIVDIAPAVGDEGRLMIVSLLAPVLQSDQDQWLRILKEVVYKIKDQKWLREVADILAKYLSAETIGAILSLGYSGGNRINVKWVGAFAPHADKQALLEALEAVSQCAPTQDPYDPTCYMPSEALREIAPRLDEESLRRAFHIAQQLQDANDRLSWLRILAPYANKQELRETLELAGQRAADGGTYDIDFEALREITPRLDEESLRRAFHIAQQLQDPNSRLSWLRILAPYANKQELRETLELAGQRAADGGTYNIAFEALREITPHLDEESLRRAFHIAQQLQDPNSRLSWLRILAPYANKQELRETLELAGQRAADVGTYNIAFKALREITPRLDEESLRRAFHIAQQLQDANDRLSWLRILAPHADQHVLRHALEAARECGAKGETNYQVVEAFIDIAPHLNKDSFRIAYDIAQNLLNIRQRLMCMSVLNKVTDKKDSSTNESHPDRTYSSTGESMPLNHEAQSAIDAKVSRSKIEAVTAISDNYQRYVELKKLIPRLSQDILASLLSSLPELMSGSPEYELSLLSFIVPRLNEKERGHAISHVTELLTLIPSGTANENEALKCLAPYMTKVVLSETLVLLRQIRDARPLNRSMVSLLPYLSTEMKEKVLGRSLELFEKDPLGFHFVGVIPYLSQQQIEALLARIIPYLETREIESRQQLLTIAKEAPSAYQHVFEEIVNIAPRFSNKFDRTGLLENVIPKVSGLARNRAIEIWLAIGPRIIDSNGLRTVVPHLSEAHLRQLMTIAVKASSTDVRVARLSKLGPFLPASLVPEALEMAKRIDEKADGVNALAKLKDSLPVMDTPAGRSLEQEYARKALERVKEYKADSYVRIQELIDVLPYNKVPETERDKVIEEAAERTLHVSDAFAYGIQVEDLWAVAPHISTELLRRLVTGARERQVANYILIEGYRVLAERLPPSEATQLRSEAADLVHTVDWLSTRKRLMESLGIFDEMQRTRWLIEVLSREPEPGVDNHQLYTDRLRQEINALSGTAQLSVWIGFLRGLEKMPRPKMLARLHERLPLLQVFGGSDWADQALKAITDVGRWWR